MTSHLALSRDDKNAVSRSFYGNIAFGSFECLDCFAFQQTVVCATGKSSKFKLVFGCWSFNVRKVKL